MATTTPSNAARLREQFLSSDFDEDYDPETVSLAGSIRRNMLKAGVEEEDSGGVLGNIGGVLNRVLDVASRPLYATAGTVGGLLEGDVNIARNIAEGLAGTDKTTFSDVITENLGIEGVGAGVLGMGLDILGDPLTYVGGGIVKGIAKEAVDTAAGKTVSRIIREVDQVGSPLNLQAKAFADSKVTERIGAGITGPGGVLEQYGTTTFTKKVRDKMRKEALTEFKETQGRIAYDATSKALREQEAGKVVFKVLGRDIAESRGLYKAGRGAADWAKETRIGNAFNKAFRNEATFIAGTNTQRRIAESSAMSQAQDYGDLYRLGGSIDGKNVYPLQAKNLNDVDADAISHALESRVDLTGVSEGIEQQRQGARTMFDHYFDTESGTMIVVDKPLQSGVKVDNFVPHYFPEQTEQTRAWLRDRKADIRSKSRKVINEAEAAGEAAVKASKKMDPGELAQKQWEWRKEGIRAGLSDEKQLRKYVDRAEKEFHDNVGQQTYKQYVDNNPVVTEYTLERAQAQGLKPYTNIRTILDLETAAHSRKMARIKFTAAVDGEFGIYLGTKKFHKKLAEEMGWIATKNHPYLPDGTYFNKEIMETLKKLDNVIYQDEAAGAGLLKLYDDALQHLKFFQTVVNPGHHLRNAMTDITNGYLDGVQKASLYSQSKDILVAAQKMDRAFILQPGEVGFDLRKATQTLDDIKITIPSAHGEFQVPGTFVWQNYAESGAKSGYFKTEIVQKSNGVMEKIRKFSENREDWGRLAHYIHALQEEAVNVKGVTDLKGLKEASDRAAQRVRKWKIDYGDKTPMEQKFMGRVIPFYTWTRKNIPIQIEALFLRPGRAMVGPKFTHNFQVAMGENPEGNEMYGLSMVPNYLREGMQVNLAGEGSGRNGVYWNPKSAFALFDLNEFLGAGFDEGPLTGVPNPLEMVGQQFGSLTPFLQVPMQQVTQHSLFTGRPEKASITEALFKTTPLGRMFYEGALEGVPGERMRDRIINELTGAGVTSINDNMIQGELRRQEDIIQRLLREKKAEREG